MKLLSHLCLGIQRMLLPALNEEMGELSAKEKRFVAICEVTRLKAFMEPCAWRGNGRKPKPRLHLARDFLAKALWNWPSTRAIIDRRKSDTHLRRLCGWKNGPNEVPDEATFSPTLPSLASAVPRMSNSSARIWGRKPSGTAPPTPPRSKHAKSPILRPHSSTQPRRHPHAEQT